MFRYQFPRGMHMRMRTLDCFELKFKIEHFELKMAKPTKSSCRELLRRGLIGQSETVRAHLNLRGQPWKTRKYVFGAT